MFQEISAERDYSIPRASTTNITYEEWWNEQIYLDLAYIINMKISPYINMFDKGFLLLTNKTQYYKQILKWVKHQIIIAVIL